jgi:hypothetical protein
VSDTSLLERRDAQGQRRRTAAVVDQRRERLFDVTLKSCGIFGVGLIADMDLNSSGDMGVVAKDLRRFRSSVCR